MLLVALPRVVVAADAHAHQHADEPVVGGVMSLDVCADGDRLHLLTASRPTAATAAERPHLLYQNSDDAGVTWSAPIELGAQQPATIAKRGMDAQVAAHGNLLVAVWPTAGSDKMGRGPMATALSSDGGRTWRAGANPADEKLTIGHSFIDITADDAGRFHLVWLDSREGKNKGLRYARSDDGGATWSPNETLDGDTCECCWNTIRCSPAGGVAVLYRDASPRDMAIVRSGDRGQTWSEPTPVGRFDWDITACPHVGGGLASDSALHAIVWTARDQATHGVYVLTSSHGGATWGDPVRVGASGASRPDLCAARDGRLVAAWDSDGDADERRGIYVATCADGGVTWSNAVRLSAPTHFASHPRLIATRDGVRAFWTETPTGKPVIWRSAPVPSSSSSPPPLPAPSR